MANDHHFPKQQRLSHKKDFQRVFSQGKKIRGYYLRSHSVPNHLGYTRLGITVSRKFGKAHERNRFKRLVREAFRCNDNQQQLSVDLVILPSLFNKTLKWQDIAKDLDKILEKLRENQA